MVHSNALNSLHADHDEYNKIMVQITCRPFCRSFCRMSASNRCAKNYWGYEKDETLTNEQLIKEEYKGIRPAPGYPACPDHTEKIKLFALLDATENIGIELTESLAMNPPASVCGWYIAHPQSHYFGIGKNWKRPIGRLCQTQRHELRRS